MGTEFPTELGQMLYGPITMFCDNTLAKKWMGDISMSNEKKHIKLHYHCVRVTARLKGQEFRVRDAGHEDQIVLQTR